MAAPIHIRVGDQGPTLTRQIVRSDGTPEALPDGSTVIVRVIDPDGAHSDYDAEIVDGATGSVRYVWPAGQPTADEIVEAEQWSYAFVVTLSDGRVITSPTIGLDILVVHPRAGAA